MIYPFNYIMPLTYVNEGVEKTVEGAFIVSAFGQKPQGRDLLKALKDEGIACTVVGDANKVGNFFTATTDAYLKAISIR